MRYLRNEDGIAMVTALTFTLLCLAMIMTLMYYVLTGTKMFAAQKKYRNSLEGTYGGAEFVTKTAIPQLFTNFSAGTVALNKINEVSDMELKFGVTGTSTASALQEKLRLPTTSWSSGVSKTVDPKTVPDFIFTLKGTGGNGYRIYSKIVDTVPAIGVVDESVVSDDLDMGAGVVGINPVNPAFRSPAIYSVEVQGEAVVNPREKAGVLILYAY